MSLITLNTQDPTTIMAVAALAAKEHQSLDVDHFIPTAERWLDYLAGIALADLKVMGEDG